MELKDFISETLCGLVEGATDAQKKLSENPLTKGTAINPLMSSSGANEKSGVIGVSRGQAGQVVMAVDFNVAVTITDADKMGGKAKINVLSGMFGVSGEKSTSSENRSVSSVKFTIPISLPVKSSTI